MCVYRTVRGGFRGTAQSSHKAGCAGWACGRWAGPGPGGGRGAGPRGRGAGSREGAPRRRATHTSQSHTDSDRASSIDLDLRPSDKYAHYTTHGLADQAITTDPRSHTPVVLLTLTLDSALERGRPHAIVQPQAHARYTQRVPPPRPHRRLGAGMASRHMAGPLCSVRGPRGAWSLAGGTPRGPLG